MTFKQISIQVLLTGAMTLLFGCVKEQITEVKKPIRVNSFTMDVDGQEWEPGQLGDDDCIRTYNGAWSWIGENPYFNISAWRDPKGHIDIDSKNVLQIQVMNVKELGKYPIAGAYTKSFQSFAFFRVTKEDGSFIRYVNKTEKPSFIVDFKQFAPRPNTNLKSVDGVFSGILYNELNPLDSIVISNGTFTLKHTNGYNFDQCN